MILGYQVSLTFEMEFDLLISKKHKEKYLLKFIKPRLEIFVNVSQVPRVACQVARCFQVVKKVLGNFLVPIFHTWYSVVHAVEEVT